MLEVFSRSLPSDHPHLQAARLGLAAAIFVLGDVEGARVLQEQVLEVFSRTLPGEHHQLQQARSDLASTLFALGNLEGACALQKQVLEVRSRTLPSDHPHLQLARVYLARTIRALGDLQCARALDEQALEVFSRTLPSDHPHLQGTRSSLATTLLALGDLEGARALDEQALEVLSRTLPGDHPHLQAARGNLANTVFALGDLEGARALQGLVLEAFSRTLSSDHPDLQAARQNLAATISDLGDLEGARALQELALEVRSRTLPGDHPDLQGTRMNLAGTIVALGDLEEGNAILEQVLEVLSRTLPGDHPLLQTARSNLARTRAAMGEARKSQQLARVLASATIRAGRLLDSLSRRELASEMVVNTVLSIASGAGVFESDATGERLGFSMCEAIRGAEATAARLARSLRADPEARALRKEIARSSRELNARADSTSEQSLTFADLVRKRDQLRRELLSRFEETGADRFLPDLNADTIRARLEPSEAAIGYWRYDRWHVDTETSEPSNEVSYLAWVLVPGQSLRRIELGSARTIERAITRWRQALGAPTRGPSREPLPQYLEERGHALRDLILDPVLEHVGEAKRLWIASAEAMTLVPFDALPAYESALGDRFEIVQLGALSELTIDQATPLRTPAILALGGIRYDGEPDPLSINEPSKASEARSTESKPLAASRGASRASMRRRTHEAFDWKFGRLPGTRGEVEMVGKYFLDAFEDTRAPELMILTRGKASRDAFETLAPKHRFVHLATHGWFAPESVVSTGDDRVIDAETGVMGSSLRDQVRGLAPSLLCGLAFAGANGEADMYGRVRGVMTAEEISAMDLTGVELCVLSACETNVGLRRGGQGIASLQSALHAAGVRTAITSLWKVPDEATRELMTEFYRRLWVLKEPKAKALWNAKKALREQLYEDGKPVFSVRDWAGWVLSGDPD